MYKQKIPVYLEKIQLPAEFETVRWLKKQTFPYYLLTMVVHSENSYFSSDLHCALVQLCRFVMKYWK